MLVQTIPRLDNFSCNLSFGLKFLKPIVKFFLLFLCWFSVEMVADKVFRVVSIKELATVDAPVTIDLGTTAFVAKFFIALTLHYMAALI